MAQKSHWFEKLNRAYPKVKGYQPFSALAKNLAYNLLAVEMGLIEGELTIKNIVTDFAWSAIIVSAWTLAHNEFPVWWLDKNLFAAFEESDIPKAIADLQQVAPFGIIMLPEGIRNPNGEYCDWVFFQFLPEGSALPVMQFGSHIIPSVPTDCDKLRWVTTLRNGTGYASTIDSNQDLDLEQQFQKRIERIVLQTLLYLQTRPDDLTPPPPTAISTKGQGFSSGNSKSERFSPLIIGQKFQPKTERVPGTAHSSHATPRTHWRRGHWRRVAIGEGRQQREWRWIQPVLVNG
ncbi:hypothetical protein [Laspinema sp. D2d]|uniref:hypothetical protein n=1 Tax=Laspinema sp. D2d TaxID=2953686 RepID=UPI0021BB0CB6|nr:hypothetical protein [Laspinema sp. D2d]